MSTKRPISREQTCDQEAAEQWKLWKLDCHAYCSIKSTKQVSLLFYSHKFVVGKFLALPAALVDLFSCDTFANTLVASYLEWQYAVVSTKAGRTFDLTKLRHLLVLHTANRRTMFPWQCLLCVGYCQTLTYSFYQSWISWFVFSWVIFGRHAFRQSHNHVTLFCNLIGGTHAGAAGSQQFKSPNVTRLFWLTRKRSWVWEWAHTHPNTNMWQSHVEIEGYSGGYFDHIAVFEALYRWTFVKGGAHTCFVDLMNLWSTYEPCP